MVLWRWPHTLSSLGRLMHPVAKHTCMQLACRLNGPSRRPFEVNGAADLVGASTPQVACIRAGLSHHVTAADTEAGRLPSDHGACSGGLPWVIRVASRCQRSFPPAGAVEMLTPWIVLACASMVPPDSHEHDVTLPLPPSLLPPFSLPPFHALSLRARACVPAERAERPAP